jgi:CubicO group peptidase (beta-lactamase class C family)
MEKNKVAGMSIALVYGDSIIWVEGLGYKDLGNKIKATPEDQYLLGSITKTFTGIGVMQLQQNRKLNIDDPFKKYLPEFNIKMLSGNINDIKIRQMMTHHSGIPSDILPNMFTKNPEDMNKIIDQVNKDYTCLPPDKFLAYSNVAVSLLGSMIEKVSGVKYMDYITINIFTPLGMKSSGFFTADNKPEGVRFAYDYKGNPAEELPTSLLPAGAVYSNVLDIAKYIEGLINFGKFHNKRFIDSTELCKMFEVQNEDVPLDLNDKIGLSWFILNNNDAGKIFEHGGGTLSHRSMLAIAPGSKLGIIILSNSCNSSNFNWMAFQILGETAKLNGYQAMKTPDKDSLSEHNFNYSTKPKFEKVKLMSTELAKYTGLYNNSFMSFNIKSNGYNLYTNLPNESRKVFLEPITGNNFRMKVKKLGLIPDYPQKDQILYFDSIQGEKMLIIRYAWGNKNLLAKQEIQEINNVWRQRLGKYKIMNQKDESYAFFSPPALKIKDGIIICSATMSSSGKPQKIQIPFTIINDNLAQVHGYDGLGGSKLQVHKNNDGSEYILFMGFELKKE